MPPPRKRTDAIEQSGNQIRISTYQWDSSGKANVVRDLEIGGPAIQVEIRNVPRLLRAYWDGDDLVVETGSTISDSPRLIEDRWTLSEDGQEIRISRFHHLPGGDVRQQLLLKRHTPDFSASVIRRMPSFER